jgi:hypothetical protein
VADCCCCLLLSAAGELARGASVGGCLCEDKDMVFMLMFAGRSHW